jgi:hypothetical protein
MGVRGTKLMENVRASSDGRTSWVFVGAAWRKRRLEHTNGCPFPSASSVNML